jgi:phosphocarrier protein HPr
MVEKTAVVQNQAGIHVRPSGVIIEELRDYSGTITSEAQGFSVELNSVMGLLSLGLVQGDEIKIKVEGPEEEKMAAQVKALFERHYDFPPRK